MKKYQLENMKGGWFVGDFNPSVINEKDFEVGIKFFCKGESFPTHYHKISKEITVIISGSVLVNGNLYQSGDIILQEPFEKSDFQVLEDTIINVVKIPSVKNDKYF